MSSNRLSAFSIWLAALLITGVFTCLLGDLVVHGWRQLSWTFLIEEPRDFGRGGGIAPVFVSTGLILLTALAAAVPVGLATAVLLAEFSPRRSAFGKLVEGSLDVLAGTPSIVFGLFGNAFFCIYLKLGFSILSGGLTLACMILPILIRTAAEGLRAAPDEYRLAAAALGLSRGAALYHLLLPAAVPALAAGLMLGIGRAGAETAALIFTSGYVDRMPESLFDSGRALSVHIYEMAMNVAGGDANAHASALLLIAFLFTINGIAMTLAERWQKRRINGI
ncbi:MAG: phosphate ABC transporter permease PstA [Gammaproteobacteria bacterium]